MEIKYGVKGTIFEDIFFTESLIENAKIIKHLHIEISLQNSNLYDVKKKMAKEAKELNSNTIMNFTYGQKKHKTFELMFSFKWDTESWHGEGDVVVIK